MRLSIVVAAHDEGDVLFQTLRSIYETASGLEFEVIVGDDGSTDGSMKLAQSQFPRARVVSLSSRSGPATAKNAGAREADGDTLLFLDAHTKPERGAIRKLLEQVEALDGQAIVSPATPILDVKQWRNSRQQMGQGYTIDLQTLTCAWTPISELRRSPQGHSELYESPALIGCAFALSQQLYELLWGQDTGMLTCGVEGVDLGMKSWLLGYPVLLDPCAVVGHRFPTAKSTASANTVQMLADQLRMARKTFTETVWNKWVQMARPRFQQSSPDIPEGIWTRAWLLFEQGRAGVEEERAYLHGRRIRDEFWFAEYFELHWPALNTPPNGSATEHPMTLENHASGTGNGNSAPHPALGKGGERIPNSASIATRPPKLTPGDRFRVTECVCSEEGWCERHQCFKDHFQLLQCQRNQQVFGQWENGNHPTQQLVARSGPSSRQLSLEVLKIPCVHRSVEPVAEIECALCGNRNKRVPLFSCDEFGECTLSRTGNQTDRGQAAYTCIGCDRYLARRSQTDPN